MIQKRDFIRRKIAEMRKAGLLADSKKLVRWRDLSSVEQTPEEVEAAKKEAQEDEEQEKKGHSEGGSSSSEDEKDADRGDGLDLSLRFFLDCHQPTQQTFCVLVEDDFFAEASAINPLDLSKREQYVVEDFTPSRESLVFPSLLSASLLCFPC